MSWTAIIGQPLAVRLLRQAVAARKVAHAYIFAGPAGIGKATVALEFAKALNCRSSLSLREACDSCPSCVKMNETPLVHPDLAWVQPEGRFIKTGQARDLQAVMYSRPALGQYRVAIVDGADHLNPEAGNRLLKLLEEPPAHAVFVLTARNLSGVLPTIISRCQIINFAPVPTEQVGHFLQDHLKIDHGQANLFAALSGGSMGRAVTIAQSPQVLERRNQAFDLLQKLHAQDDFDLLTFAETFDKERESLDEWVELVIMWLRDTLLVDRPELESLLINTDKLSGLQGLSTRYSVNQLLHMLDICVDIRGRLQRNANVRLCLEMLLLRLQGV